MCCQKTCEAEACVDGGILDVYVCNQVVAPRKIARLVALAARGAAVSTLVDSADNARALSAAAGAAGVRLRVLVEYDVGGRRCGVLRVEAVVGLAALPALEFGGIHAYDGNAQHARSAAARDAAAQRVAAAAQGAVDALAAAGVACKCVTGGGSGTFVADAACGVLTELQPGSYVLSDADYSRNLRADGAESWGEPWTPALTLLATVCSRREDGDGVDGGPGWVVIDAGLKAQSVDSGPPVVLATVQEYAAACGGISSGGEGQASPALGASSPARSLAVASVSDEHSTLVPPRGEPLPSGVRVGDKLVLLFGHCDPSVNHYDWLVAHRRGVVEAVWRLAARSPGA